MSRPVTASGVACVLAFAIPAGVGAQAIKPPAQSTGPKWEISFHGGMASGSATPDGLSNTPLMGPSFTMADGATPTRAVSSWYFGDGASFLNQVLQLRGSTARLDGLHLPDWPAASRRGGPQLGVRIAHHVTGSMWLEYGVDVGLDPLGFGDDVRGRIENTRADFETVFTALANSSPAIASSSVTSTADFVSNGRRMILSAVVHHRGDGPVMRPFLLAGIGVAATFGDPAVLTLDGAYRFTPPGQAAIEEFDTARLRYSASGSLVWIAGGGMMRDISRTSSYRVEARVMASRTKVKGTLEAEPRQGTTSGSGALVLNATNPGVQFSSSAIRPTLSGPSLLGFEAFTGDGRAFQWVVSAAYVRRF